MKKLRVILTLLLALCCSFCMFACGGGEKSISSVELSGQKKEFQEGEEFSLGDIKVIAYYQGDDEPHELKADEYEVDSSAYKKDVAGEYIIYIIPKNQPAELTANGKDNRYKESYFASVVHNWQQSGEGAGMYECKCGAKRNLYETLEDKISTVAWGQQATLTRGGEGKTYPDAKDPIAGENHVTYGSLVKGQSLKLELQINALTRSADGPGAASAWDTPLMGIRNAGVGMIPREDGWIIATAAGFALPADSNIPSGGKAPDSGTAQTTDKEWTVYGSGTTWSAGSAFPNDAKNPTAWSSVTVDYIYQADDIFMIRHTLHKFDGTTSVYTITTKVPEAAYDIVVYGEYCDFTVTAAEFVAGRAIETFEISSQPANPVQPAGKLFDATGLDTKAVFSDKGELKGSYNAYAYHYVRTEVEEEVPVEDGEDGATQKVKKVYYDKTRVNLASEPLQSDFFGFFVEFNGKQAFINAKGEEIVAAERIAEADFSDTLVQGLQAQDTVKVVPTVITGANSSAIKLDDVVFESPDLVYDYAVTDTKKVAESYIRLTMSGAAVKATSAQAEKLGNGATHFIAFKLVTNLADDAFDAVEATGATAKKAGTTVDVVVGLKAGFTAFDLTLKKGADVVAKIKIDLGTLDKELPAYGAEVTDSTFTLDAGGEYTVEFTGLGDEAKIKTLHLPMFAKDDTVETIMNTAKGAYTGEGEPTEQNAYKTSNSLYITNVTISGQKLIVKYWLAAPDLGNLTAENSVTTVRVTDGNATLVSADLVYTLAVSGDVIEIGEGVYVKASNNKLQVYAYAETTDIKDGASFAATVNIEHPLPEDDSEVYTMVYNVGVSIRNGVAAWLDENELTANSASAAKLVAYGTVNDATDYDKGYVLVANLHLPALGVRADSSTRNNAYHFTANEDVVSGQDTYTIYTVGDSTRDNSNVITSENKTPDTEREKLSTGSCVKDGVQAYKDGNFYYGALIEYASGAHTFAGYAGDATTDTCTVCGAVKTKVVDGDTVYEYTVLSQENMSTFTNPIKVDDAAWWLDGQQIGTQELGEGNFVITYAWDQVDANYSSDGAVTIYPSETEGASLRKRFLEPATDQNWAQTLAGSGLITTGSEDPADDSTITYHIYDKDGEEVTYDVDFKALDNGRWLGNYEVTIVRLGTTLRVYEKVVTSVEPSRTFTSELVITNFTTEALTVCLWGSPAWCGETVRRDIGAIAFTQNLGTENWVYTDAFTNWYEVPATLMYGHSITMSGKLVATGTNAWETVYCEIKDAVTVRTDNWAWSFGAEYFGHFEGGQQSSVASTNAEGEWFDIYQEIRKENCNYRINVSWKDANKVIVTMDFWKDPAANVNVVYTFTLAKEAPAEGFGVHFCGEKSTVTYETLTVE